MPSNEGQILDQNVAGGAVNEKLMTVDDYRTVYGCCVNASGATARTLEIYFVRDDASEVLYSTTNVAVSSTVWFKLGEGFSDPLPAKIRLKVPAAGADAVRLTAWGEL